LQKKNKENTKAKIHQEKAKAEEAQHFMKKEQEEEKKAD
jgi:hypothetical protein